MKLDLLDTRDPLLMIGDNTNFCGFLDYFIFFSSHHLFIRSDLILSQV